MESKLTFFNKFAYGVSDFGNNLIFVAVTNYLMFYYTDIVGLNLAVVGMMFLVIRVLDAIAGPVFGVLVDKTNTKWGKVRPWFLWMSIPYGLSAVLLFSLGMVDKQYQVVVAYITYGIFNVCYAGIGNAINSILPSLTPKVSERAQANMFRNVLGQIGGFSSSLIILPLVTLLGAGINQAGFFKAILIFSVVLVLAELTTFFGVREYEVNEKLEPIKLKEGLKALLPNIPWWLIATTNFIIFIGVVVKNSTAVYYYKYILDNANISAISNALGALAMIGGAIAVPILIKKFKMRNIVLFGLVIAVIGQGILYLSYNFLSVPLALIGNFIGSAGLGGAQSLMFVMTAETVDYAEWKFGIRAQGLLISMSTIGVNIGAGLAGVISSEVLAKFGFVANAAQTNSSIFGINLLFIVIPVLTYVICGFIMSFYRLDSESEKMHADLALRHAAEETAVLPENIG